jgi:hypothetical protein
MVVGIIPVASIVITVATPSTATMVIIIVVVTITPSIARHENAVQIDSDTSLVIHGPSQDDDVDYEAWVNARADGIPVPQMGLKGRLGNCDIMGRV